MPEILQTTVDKFTFTVPTDRLYTRDGLWVRPLAAGAAAHVRVGLTDYQQQHSGDLAFATVKRAGTTVRAGEELAEVETVKVNLSVPAPISGTVVEVNPALELTPEVVNRAPYDDGWLAVLEATDLDAERVTLLDPEAYFAAMRQQAEEELKQP